MFKINLSSEQRQRLQADRNEIHRLYLLSDTALAIELLTMARTVRSAHPEDLSRDRYCYDTHLVWDLVPEIARRLGIEKTEFLPGEWQDNEFPQLENPKLRNVVALYIANINSYRFHEKDSTSVDPWKILTQAPIDGNPLAFAMERICPVDTVDESVQADELAKRISEVQKYRGNDGVRVWQPDWERHPDELKRPLCAVAQQKLLNDASMKGDDFSPEEPEIGFSL